VFFAGDLLRWHASSCTTGLSRHLCNHRRLPGCFAARIGMRGHPVRLDLGWRPASPKFAQCFINSSTGLPATREGGTNARSRKIGPLQISALSSRAFDFLRRSSNLRRHVTGGRQLHDLGFTANNTHNVQ